MPARVPQDVDLEDRLVFNLTTVQFGYLVIGALGAALVWKVPWAPEPPRVLAAVPLVLCGVILAWGRWHGRGLDAWTGDGILFLRDNLRLRWRPTGMAGAFRRFAMRRGARVPRSWLRHRHHRPRPLRLPEHRE